MGALTLTWTQRPGPVVYRSADWRYEVHAIYGDATRFRAMHKPRTMAIDSTGPLRETPAQARADADDHARARTEAA